MYSSSLSSSKSAFSDKNLSTLESLVLEVALEDAHQQLSQHNIPNNGRDGSTGTGTGSGTLTPKDCEMSSIDYQAIIKLPGNDLCADCSSHDTEWASVTFGILLCAQCSGVHRALGTHISRVRSIKMDNWSKDHLDIMRVGGNRKCRRYLECHNIPVNEEIPIKYSSEGAEKYKKILKERVEKRRKKELLDASNNSNSSMADESFSSFAQDGSITNMNEIHNNPKQRTGSDGRIMEDDSGGGWENNTKEQEQQQQQSSTLDSWFNMSTKRRPPSLRGSSAHSNSIISGPSSHSRMSGYRRSHSSNSTPTIVYMGKSFSADGSDAPHLAEHVQQGKARMRSQSDIKLLAEISYQQEEIARANLTASQWRQSAPMNFWSSDKKVEPFEAGDSAYHYYGGGGHGGGRTPHRHYSFSGSYGGLGGGLNSDDARRRARHQESMRQKLAYSDADVLKIAQDDQEFARLKAGLKHKGAVTNEVLKQKLYAFVAKSKLRAASTTNNNNSSKNGGGEKATSSSTTTGGNNNNNNNNNKQTGTSRSSSKKSDDMLGGGGGGPRSKTIHTSTAQRL